MQLCYSLIFAQTDVSFSFDYLQWVKRVYKACFVLEAFFVAMAFT